MAAGSAKRGKREKGGVSEGHIVSPATSATCRKIFLRKEKPQKLPLKVVPPVLEMWTW
jgi:hypothetical protein